MPTASSSKALNARRQANALKRAQGTARNQALVGRNRRKRGLPRGAAGRGLKRGQ